MSNDKKGSVGEKAMKRIDEYNKHPNLCLCCNKPILALYDKRLKDIKIKKFCSKSCAAKFNNLGKVKNEFGIGLKQDSIIDNFSDEEIIEIFNNSSNLTEFSKSLGYKYKIHKDNKSINDRLKKINLNLDDITLNKPKILPATKGELFERYAQWQTARAAIQKSAKQTYDSSDKPKECIICGYDKHYEVAHIKAVSEFDANSLISEINDINNLIALCPNHHWEYDNADLDISKYIN